MWPFNKNRKSKALMAAKKRAYAGAMFGRLVADWVSSSTSQDSEIRGGLTALRNRSRDLGRNNDYVRNFLRTVQNNVVGQGVQFQSQVRSERGGGLNDKVNAQIEQAWNRWCRQENCHTAGKLSFCEIERLLIRNIAEAGEVLVRFVYQPMGTMKTPLALEIIEPDLLDENYNDFSVDGNRVRMGVETNQWGRPVAYHFFTSHPGDTSLLDATSKSPRRVRVPANEILHLYLAERWPQGRGVPWLVSAIMRLHHMQGYEEAEVIAARASAALMGFIESPEGEASISDDVDAGDKVTEFEPGVFKTLAPGEKVNVPQISRPGGQFDPFMRLMLRGVAAGVGASYESLSRDYSQSNYSSSRQGLIEDRDNWRVLQWWIISKFHQVVFEKFVEMAVLAGDLSLKNYETNPEAYYVAKWMPRGWSWVDPVKEVAAYKEAVRNGFLTQSEVIAQTGADIEEVYAQREREIKLAREKGLVFDSDPALINGAGAEQGASGNQAPPAPKPESE